MVTKLNVGTNGNEIHAARYSRKRGYDVPACMSEAYVPRETFRTDEPITCERCAEGGCES